jgi:hypothetical protein
MEQSPAEKAGPFAARIFQDQPSDVCKF